MILAPTDFAAFSQATGTPYPDSPDQKAALYPIVSEWKASQQAAAAENRGPSAVGIGMTLLGAAGLGAGGLAIYNQLRRQGLSSEAAAQKARELEVQQAEVTAASRSAAPPPAVPAREKSTNEVRTLQSPRRFPRTPPAGPKLRADGYPTAVLQNSSAPGSTSGGERARASGQYRARSSQGFHDPAVAALDTPEKRDLYLQELARTHGTDSKAFNNALAAIRAMEVTTPSGPGTTDPRSLIAHLSPEERTGTTTAAEAAARGRSITTSRTKSNTSAQDGYTARDVAPQWQAVIYAKGGDLRQLLKAQEASSPGDRDATAGNTSFGIRPLSPNAASSREPIGIDPSKASVFYKDSDGSLQPYIGSEAIYGEKGKIIYTGRRADGTPIRESHLEYFPTDDPEYYQRTGLSHPYLPLTADSENTPSVALNASYRVDERLADKEDQGVKGLMEALPASRGRINPKTTDFGFSLNRDPLVSTAGAAPGELQEARLKLDHRVGRTANSSLISVEQPLWSVQPVPRERLYVLEAGTSQPITLDGVRLSWADVKDPARNLVRWKTGTDAPMERVMALNDDGSPVLVQRSATVEDLRGYVANQGPDAPLYRGRTSSEGVSKNEGVDDNRVFGSVSGTREGKKWTPDKPTLLDASGFQSETLRGSPALIAGKRLQLALADHANRTGMPVPPETVHQWAEALGRQHSADPANVLKVAYGTVGQQGPRPAAAFTREHSAPALAAGTGDALDRVYTSLGMHANDTEWELEANIRSGNIKAAAESLANELPDLTRVFTTYMPGLSADERLNIVAEGVSAGLNDLSTAVRKYPEEAAKFGIGNPDGGFSVDGFVKSYVRDWVTTRALQFDPSGQPTYRVPADAFELIALDADANGRPVLDELQSRIAGSPDGVTAALKLDRLVSSVQSTKEGDPNNNASRFAQLVFDSPDDELLSTRLVGETKGDVRLSFSSRMRDDATKGSYDGNLSDADVEDRFWHYDLQPTPNKILRNRRIGTDKQDEAYDAVSKDVLAKQAWITQNAENLERERVNLNRGIISTPDGPRSIGRGLVISAGQRGAFLAADTAGVNAAFREETFNDDDATPVDVRQQNARDDAFGPVDESGAVILDGDGAIQRPAASIGRGEVTGNSRGEVPALTAQGFAFSPETEANTTARQYAGSKLFFKNLGTQNSRNSTGAMAAGEAFEPRRNLRGYLADLQERRRSDAALDQAVQGVFFGGSRQPLQQPKITITNRRATGGGRSTGSSPLLVAIDEGTWRNVATGKPDHWGTTHLDALVEDKPTTWVRSDSLTFDQLKAIGARTPGGFGPGIDPHGAYGERGVQSALRPPADPYAGIISAPRSAVTPEGNPATAKALESFTASRNTARRSPEPASFSDDANKRDAIALASGYVEAVKRANQQGAAVTPPPQLVDEGELTGVGRRGSTFAQAPISAAVGSQEFVELANEATRGPLPAAAHERLNTLRQEMEAAVPAGPTSAERQAAQASIAGDYWDKVVSRGGFRPTKDGSANLNGMPAFTPPSDATIAGRVNFLRKRGIL